MTELILGPKGVLPPGIYAKGSSVCDPTDPEEWQGVIDNPEEGRFAEAWRKCDHLEYLVDDNGANDQRGRPTVSEEITAATIIQWSGSPVGQWFLWDLGYERKIS